MGTIADKLLYLNGTKQSFKTDLNAVGAEITDQTTFRNYLQWLDDLYDSTSEKTKLAEEGIEGNTKQSILPSEYTQVDYIQSSGSQYIDTGINADTKLRTILDIAYINPTNANQTMGAINIGTPNKRYHILSSSNSISFWVNDANYVIINSASTDRHLWDLNIPEGKVVLDNTTTTTISTNIDDVELSFWLFGRNSNATQYKAPFKLWACKMYYNGTLVRDYIPCYRNSDNEVGLYDLVNDVFYTNQGTGVFTYGSVIPNPDYPQEIVNISGKNTLKDVGKNLFDKKNPNVINGYINGSHVIKGNNESKIIYIECEPNTTYSMQKMLQETLNANRFRVGTSENIPAMNTTLSNYYNAGDGSSITEYTLTTNSSAHYLVFFCYNAEQLTTFNEMLDSIQIEESSTVTTYEPYQGQSFDLDLKSKNLFDKDNVIVGKVYNSNGELVNSGQWNTNNDFEKVNENKVSISCKTTGSVNSLLIEFDENKNFIQRQQVNYGSSSLTLNTNTKYIRYCYQNTLSMYDIQIEENPTPTEYEPYYNINLCEIDNYKDRIYSLNGKWYLEKFSEKVTIDGTNIAVTNRRETNTSGNYSFTFLFSKKAKRVDGTITQGGYCNKLISKPRNNIYGRTQGFGYGATNNDYWGDIVIFRTDWATKTVADVNTDLKLNPIELEYLLDSAETIEITESNYPTLYEQLQEIQDYLIQYKINKEFLLGYAEPSIEIQ